MARVPDDRIERLNERSASPDGKFVVYWMTSARRVTENFALDRALEWCRELQKPLVILEALRSDYPWASERFHRFVMDGMLDNERALEDTPATYYAYLEPTRGAGKGLLESLALESCVIVTDRFPCYFLPAMHRAAAAKVDVRFEAVDTNGLLPLSVAPKPFARAVDFRRFLQRNLEPYLMAGPLERPFAAGPIPRLPELPSSITERWVPARTEDLVGDAVLSRLPIDHSVGAVDVRGGSEAAGQVLSHFLESALFDYGEDRNVVDASGTSGLSPYLHFGHVSTWRVWRAIADGCAWTPDRLGSVRNGSRSGWWGLPEGVEGFLDQLVTWRELGYVFCDQRPDYDRYASLPDWARSTLEDHVADHRPYSYDLETLENADSHDEIWNAAQTQLRREGRIHNYLRMLWGKKVLEWTEHPEVSLQYLVDLNNRYALDGRNPNSYSGIFWTFGRFDRAWGPERPIYGKVRYMSSDNTRRKLKLADYLERYAEEGAS
ncbi:MAG: deoxyribodipyrimidine photolyase [Planctomycetes bacterium]|nr:deoxyribodipyrimidine photolyase [Planctomycetota bacterium]